MSVPENPKIYHIVHVDRLQSIIEDGFIWCDAEIVRQPRPGTTIGLSGIKRRRLYELKLASHPELFVGDCAPFYFCPRSVMLYIIYRGNDEELSYRDGQEKVVHLEADLGRTVSWASEQGLRWAFTLSNAGSRYFEDRCSLEQLSEINWEAVIARQWSPREIKDGKQAEFLVENRFPWHLIERVGTHSERVRSLVTRAMAGADYKPPVMRIPEWYY